MNLIEKALELYPETRNDDKKLILAVWYLQDNNYDKNFRHFFQTKAKSPETIRRTRQRLQEQGLYRSNEKIEQYRYELFKKARWSRGATVVEDIL